MKDPILSFFVPGTALPKGSPEIMRNRGRSFVREKEELYVWQNAVTMVAAVTVRQQEPPRWQLIDTAVQLEIVYILPRKKSAKPDESCIELAAVKPDMDKCERAVYDALQGVVYTQDSRVTSCCHKKRVAPHGRPELVGVTILVGLDTEE